MRTYTLQALRNFTDKYDENIKYKQNEKMTDIEEERALELLSSKIPVVRYLSHKEDNAEVENIKLENDTLKNENQELKNNLDTITSENDTLQTTIANLTTELETLKNENQEKNKEQNNKK